jgi:signal recognition particle receptor subunit beta
LLIFANKQDSAGAKNADELTAAMGLQQMIGNGRKWHVQGCSATSGEGINEGLSWLLQTYKEENKKK